MFFLLNSAFSTLKVLTLCGVVVQFCTNTMSKDADNTPWETYNAFVTLLVESTMTHMAQNNIKIEDSQFWNNSAPWKPNWKQSLKPFK